MRQYVSISEYKVDPLMKRSNEAINIYLYLNEVDNLMKRSN